MAGHRTSKSAAATLIFSFAALFLIIVFQDKFNFFEHLTGDLPLVFLTVAALCLPIAQVALLSVSAALMLNWQPVVSRELALIMILPVIVFFVKKISPWKSSMTAVSMSIFSFILFYSFIDAKLLLANAVSAAEIAAVNSIFALIFASFFKLIDD